VIDVHHSARACRGLFSDQLSSGTGRTKLAASSPSCRGW